MLVGMNKFIDEFCYKCLADAGHRLAYCAGTMAIVDLLRRLDRLAKSELVDSMRGAGWIAAISVLCDPSDDSMPS